VRLAHRPVGPTTGWVDPEFMTAASAPAGDV
jgi:hypothetical protein